MEGCYCGKGTYWLNGDKEEIIDNIIKFTYESLPENLRTPNMMRDILEQSREEINNLVVTISLDRKEKP